MIEEDHIDEEEIVIADPDILMDIHRFVLADVMSQSPESFYPIINLDEVDVTSNETIINNQNSDEGIATYTQSPIKITDKIINDRMVQDDNPKSPKIWIGKIEKKDINRQIKITKGRTSTTVNKSKPYASIWPPERQEVSPAEVSALRSELTAYLDQRESSTSTKSARSSKVEEQYHLSLIHISEPTRPY